MNNERYDVSYIKKIMELLGHREAGGVTEVRIFPKDRYLTINGKREYVGKTVSGYYDNYAKLAEDAAPFDGKGSIFVTINPCKAELLARAINRLRYNADTTTSDDDIRCDLWFPIDVDPIRPTDISSTHDELQAALRKRNEVVDFLAHFGVDAIKGMSGNGGHALIRLIGYPNSLKTRQAKERLTHFLSEKFSDDAVSVDNTVFNMSRLWKLYGTLACKGDSTQDRPHRSAYLDIPESLPDPIDLYGLLDEIIPPEQEPETSQKKAATPKSKTQSKTTDDYPLLDVPAYLDAAGVEWRTKEKGDKTWYQFRECPIHTDDDSHEWECGICQGDSGKMGAKCMHEPSYTWQDFKQALGDPKSFYVGAQTASKKTAAKEVDLFAPKEKKKYFIKKTFIPKKLADELMDEYRFIYATERLYVYRGGVYVPKGELLVKQRCRELLGNAARVNRINEVIAHISDMTHTEPEELNVHDNLLNIENGMHDWINDELLAHDPDYLSTVRIPVEYASDATCPTVDYFFETTLPEDCIPIVEELFGYALIPYVRFEKAFMLTGVGANGKSTFLTLLEAFVGSKNVSKVPLQELDEHKFKRAELFGKLVNLFADLDSSALRSSSYFKIIVSGDQIDAERKYKDPFFFRPFARLVYSANQLPTSPDKSFAYYRRWVIMPFPHQFTGTKADKSLGDKLIEKEELSGLFNRALTGLNRLFKKQEFSQSATVQEALDDYKKQNDTVTAFVSDHCEFDPHAKTERTELYNAYTTYCEAEGFEKESRRACYNRIRAYPQVNEQKEPKARYFIGIRIKKT